LETIESLNDGHDTLTVLYMTAVLSRPRLVLSSETSEEFMVCLQLGVCFMPEVKCARHNFMWQIGGVLRVLRIKLCVMT